MITMRELIKQYAPNLLKITVETVETVENDHKTLKIRDFLEKKEPSLSRRKNVEIVENLVEDSEKISIKNNGLWIFDTTSTVSTNSTSNLDNLLSEEGRYDYEERAAILEYDGGLSRPQAEALAKLYILKRSENFSSS